MLGIAEEREAPTFARQTFRDWFATRPTRRATPAPAANGSRGRVVLWPDTFTDLFEPDAGKAAVDVLEAAGFAVELPRKRVCCGRPLYDFGMLGLAKRTLEHTLATLSEPITSGVPVLVLEPSCASVFRDELRKLLPHDEHARRLVAQTVVLDELLDRYAPDWQPPQVGRRALIHGHCHQKAVIGARPDLLRRAGVDAEMTKAGCCGMAGSFGYHAGEQYEVSMRIGEQFLLPQVRSADPGHAAGRGRVLLPDPDRHRDRPARGSHRPGPRRWVCKRLHNG